MNSFGTKSITVVLAYGLLLGIALSFILGKFFPQYYPNWFEGILCFFLIIESAIVMFVSSRSKNVNSKQMLNVYMLTKVFKVFTSLAFILAYLGIVGENMKSFVLIFMLFYLLFLLVETLIFMKLEKQLKNKKIE